MLIFVICHASKHILKSWRLSFTTTTHSLVLCSEIGQTSRIQIFTRWQERLLSSVLVISLANTSFRTRVAIVITFLPSDVVACHQSSFLILFLKTCRKIFLLRRIFHGCRLLSSPSRPIKLWRLCSSPQAWSVGQTRLLFDLVQRKFNDSWVKEFRSSVVHTKSVPPQLC